MIASSWPTSIIRRVCSWRGKPKDRLMHLWEEFPKVPQYQKELALVCSTLGWLEQRKIQSAQANGDLELAIDLSRRLVDRFPKVPGYRTLYANACLRKANGFA